jgi:hypothetical protein
VLEWKEEKAEKEGHQRERREEARPLLQAALVVTQITLPCRSPLDI